MAFQPTGPAADLLASDRAGGPAPERDAVTVRSVLSTSSSLRVQAGDAGVDLLGSHAVLPDGTVVLAVDAMTALGGRLVAARSRPGGVRLDLTQLVPVPVRCRVRARVTVYGTARTFDPAILDACDTETVLGLLDLPAAALWAVQPTDIRLERDRMVTPVARAAYRAARPDPVAAVETAHLQHLVRHHAGRFAALAGVPAAAPTRYVPIAIDAGGITVRAETGHRHQDVRLPFGTPVTSESGLVRELRALLARAA